MTISRFQSISIEYVRVPVSATENGVLVDPTSDVVSMAIIGDETTLDGGDFVTCGWEVDGTTYRARRLVDFSTLQVGFYDVYVKIVDNPEVPVIRSGTIEVYSS